IRCKPQVPAFEQLFTHVDKHRGHLVWGKGASPGVSGLYRLVSGPQQKIWNASTNTGAGNDGPSMYFYPGEIKARVSDDQFNKFVSSLEAIGPLKSKIDEARKAGWTGKYPTVQLTKLKDGDLKYILAAIEGLLPASSVSSTG
ncbi:MAG TPA: hypothetical protein VFN57_17430, partial [Thermomicrobiaceae bacterium]|nr:hypothetical protein [Thermomicrobiaceae bacterium]